MILLKTLKKSLNKRMKLGCSNLIYALNQLIIKISPNIQNPNLVNTKKKLVSLLKNMNLLGQTLVK